VERKLASLQIVTAVDPIPESDNIEVCTVLGWKVVVLKGKVKKGDAVVYIEVDSVVPDIPVFDFLRKHKFRVKSTRLRGQISQGLVVTLDEMQTGGSAIGEDITEKLGITKYEPPVPLYLDGKVIGVRPHFVPKTDEFRLQSFPELLDEMRCRSIYISTKIDGTSSSIYYNPYATEPFGVCSRNQNLARDPNNGHWKVALRYDIQKKIASNHYFKDGVVIQGELAGPGIQKNRMGLKEIDLFVFNIYDLASDEYLDVFRMREVCNLFGLKTVSINVFRHPRRFTVDEWIERAEGKYEGTENQREGIVVRTTHPTRTSILDGALLSFKVLNNNYKEE
jgi:RNA ligase (TIGR02306 family)